MSCQGSLREQLFYNSSLAAEQWRETWQEINQLRFSDDHIQYIAANRHPFVRRNRWRAKLGWPFITWGSKEAAFDALREIHQWIDDRCEFEPLFLQLTDEATTARMKIVTGVTDVKLIDQDEKPKSLHYCREYPYTPSGLNRCASAIGVKQSELNRISKTLSDRFGYTEQQFAHFAKTHDRI